MQKYNKKSGIQNLLEDKVKKYWYQNVLKVPKVESTHYAGSRIASFKMYKSHLKIAFCRSAIFKGG